MAHVQIRFLHHGSVPRRFWTILLFLAIQCVSRAEERRLFDFEEREPVRPWRTIGPISIEARNVTDPSLSDREPSGLALWIAARNRAILSTTAPKSAHWPELSEINLWIHRSPEEANRDPQTILDLIFSEPDGKAQFSRRLDLDHIGWRRFSLPLESFRQRRGRIARWDRVTELGLEFREPATIRIDNISASDNGDGPYLTADDLLPLAFPDTPAESIAKIKRDNVLLLSDARELKIDRLVEHLANVQKAVAERLPFLDKPYQPPCLIVFARRQDYEQFTPRLAKLLIADAQPPKAGGFTIHGIATSFWDDKIGTERPVYTHEFIHSLLERTALLPNHGEWVQEGIATLFQLQFHPQQDIATIVRDGIANDQFHLPLSELTNGKSIPMNRYWQAATLWEMLSTDPRYRPRLPALFAAFQKSASTNLHPHLPVLNTDWPTVTQHWKSFCLTHYANK